MSVANDEIVVALYDYTAKDPEELSIRKNEQLVLLDAKFTWWKVRNNTGKLGLVPSNYLRRDKAKGNLVNRIANKLPGAKSWKLGGSGGAGMAGSGGGGARPGGGSMYPNPSSSPSMNQPSAQPQMNEEYVSKFNYDATKDDELSLSKGMRVLVIEMEGDGWWYGRDADRPGNPGWFPSNYVTKQEHNPPSSAPAFNNPPPSTKQHHNDCMMVVRALYTFNSTNNEELAFEQDELLDIIEQPSNDPEWWLARNSEGTTGLVPQNYVETVPNAPSVFHRNYDAVTPLNGTMIPTVNSEPPPPSNSNQLHDKDWFFGPIRRVDAERLLGDRARNGEFLVRNCETAQGEFSISMRVPGKMRHFKVTVLPSGQYGIGQRQFESMDALLEHYKHAPIFTSQQQGKVYLTNPVQR